MTPPKGEGVLGAKAASSSSRRILLVHSQRVSDGGGTPEEATPGHKDDGQFTNRNPYFLPDGKHFLFVQRSTQESWEICTLRPSTGVPPRSFCPLGPTFPTATATCFT